MKYNVIFYFNKQYMIDKQINIIELLKNNKILEGKRTSPDYLHHLPMICFIDLNDIEFKELMDYIMTFPYKEFIIEVKIKFK